MKIITVCKSLVWHQILVVRNSPSQVEIKIKRQFITTNLPYTIFIINIFRQNVVEYEVKRALKYRGNKSDLSCYRLSHETTQVKFIMYIFTLLREKVISL